MNPRVLVLSRNYPNTVMPQLGLWVERLVRHLTDDCDLHVIAPVPYVPPLPRSLLYAGYRGIPRRESRYGISVDHPRFLTGPGYSLHSLDGNLYYWAVRPHVHRLRETFPFDLIHAHFAYPDGVAAARLGASFGVPVVITEHAPWHPWMDQHRWVRRQAVWASTQSRFHLAVSRYVMESIRDFRGHAEGLRVVPLGVDGAVFAPRNGAHCADPGRILYVGRIHQVKGVDVLLRAIDLLSGRRPGIRLQIIGGSLIYRGHRKEEERIRHLARSWGLLDIVEFAGEKSPADVASAMRDSALLVLPSRAESFGEVLLEALACGIPVVATRSGGPEEIVRDDVGVLVPTEDPAALAAAIERVLEGRGSFDPSRLRAYALGSFGWDRIAQQHAELYRQALKPA